MADGSGSTLVRDTFVMFDGSIPPSPAPAPSLAGNYVANPDSVCPQCPQLRGQRGGGISKFGPNATADDDDDDSIGMSSFRVELCCIALILFAPRPPFLPSAPSNLPFFKKSAPKRSKVKREVTNKAQTGNR